MHDTVDLEGRGVPMVFVATTEFVSGAEVQSKALGARPIGVYVEHPIQDRTDDEIRAIAAAAVDEIVIGLTS